jgi:hypothetical protein
MGHALWNGFSTGLDRNLETEDSAPDQLRFNVSHHTCPDHSDVLQRNYHSRYSTSTNFFLS